jgi:hypothetical protein
MVIPLELPLSNDTLKFTMYDYDFGMRDDMVCSFKFSIKDILKSDSSRNKKDVWNAISEEFEPEMTYTMRWVNLYGCNKDHTGFSNLSHNTTQMEIQNDDVNEAAAYMGRILIEYSTIDC